MTNGAISGGAAGAAAAIAQAIRASGAIVRVEPQDFELILRRMDRPLVVRAIGGLLTKYHQYLTSYKGLAFYTKSQTELMLPGSSEIIRAGKIWIPG